MGLREVLEKVMGSKCRKMVKITGTEISISTVKVGFGGATIDVGEFKNTYRELYRITPTLEAMDTVQYQLCQYAENLPIDDPERRDCERMRLQSIIGFSNLESKLAFKDDERFKDEIEEWMHYMDALLKATMEFLCPQAPGWHAPAVRPLAEAELRTPVTICEEEKTGGRSGGGTRREFAEDSGRPGGRKAHAGIPETQTRRPSDAARAHIEAELKRIGAYQGIDENELETALTEVLSA